jgi:hypothetical protein
MDQVLESANENEQETVQSDACFELMPKDEMAPKLKFIFRNGNRCTIPYAYFLRMEFDIEGILYLFTTEKEVVIEGRGLDYLEDRLYDNQVVWIRESKGALDAGQSRVFVKRVEVWDRKG